MQMVITSYKYAYSVAIMNPDHERSQQDLAESEYELMATEREYYRQNIQAVLMAFKIPTMPERPDIFPDDNEDLLDVINSIRSKHKPTGEEFAFLKIFGLWRGAIMKAEIVSVGRLCTLLSSSRALDYTDDIEAFEELSRFVLAEYGVNLPPVPKSSKESRIIAGRACRQNQLLPDILLTEKKKIQPTTCDSMSFESMF